MGTTVATVDSARVLDCIPGERERQMEETLSRHWSSFYRTALRCLGNAADAEDAVQDALLSAHKHLKQFRGQAQLSTWLTAIVTNSARMKLRRRSRQPHVSLDEHFGEQESYALSDLLPHRGPSAEEDCCKSELAEHVLHLARQLSPTLRTAFQLRELSGLSIREMAHILGVAEGTVKARIARARAKLRWLMGKRIGAAALACFVGRCSGSGVETKTTGK